MASLPESNSSVQRDHAQDLETTGGSTAWSPYQKLHWAETRYDGELVAYQLMTNDSWYQYVVNLSDELHSVAPGVVRGRPAGMERIQHAVSFLPRIRPRCWCSGSGMGNDVAAALRNGAGRVTAVEIDPMILQLGKRLHFEHPYSDPRVTIVNDDARSYMQNAKDRFDLITFSLLDSHTTSSHYSNIRIDNYVYTREALTAARKLLTPDGVMVVKFQVGKAVHRGPSEGHANRRLRRDAGAVRRGSILQRFARNVLRLRQPGSDRRGGRGTRPAASPGNTCQYSDREPLRSPPTIGRSSISTRPGCPAA